MSHSPILVEGAVEGWTAAVPEGLLTVVPGLALVTSGPVLPVLRAPVEVLVVTVLQLAGAPTPRSPALLLRGGGAGATPTGSGGGVVEICL